MSKFCAACGSEVVDGSLFCQKCGHRLDQGGEDPQELTFQDDRPAAEAESPAERLRAAAGKNAEDEPEETLWEGGFSAKAVVGAWIVAGLLTIAGSAIGIWQLGVLKGLFIALLCAVLFFGGVGLYLGYRKLSVRYVLTNHWFIHKSGVLRRVTDRIEIIDVDDVTFEQGLVERFLGVGTIKVLSSDRSHPELWMHGIDDVQVVASTLDDIRRKERRRRGLHIESI